MTAEHPLAPHAVVTTWQRGRRQRAYVTIDGVSIGYRDLVTGKVHCPDPMHVHLITCVTGAHHHALAPLERAARLTA